MNLVARFSLRIALLALTVAWAAHLSAVVWNPDVAAEVGQAVAADTRAAFQDSELAVNEKDLETAGEQTADALAPVQTAVEDLWVQLTEEGERPDNIVDWVMHAAGATKDSNTSAAATEQFDSLQPLSALGAVTGLLKSLVRPALLVWVIATVVSLVTAVSGRSRVLTRHGIWALSAAAGTLLVGAGLGWLAKHGPQANLTAVALDTAWGQVTPQAAVLAVLGAIVLAAGLVLRMLTVSD